MPRRRRSLLLVTLAALAALGACKPRVRVPSDLRDVPDEEEDEDWKEWGETKASRRRYEEALHGPSFDAGEGMPDGMMGGMMGGGGSSGPKLCFATLTADPERTKKETESMAMRFSELLRSGGAPEHQVYTIDENTILFSVVKDGHAGAMEIRDFVLRQDGVDTFELDSVKYTRDMLEDDEDTTPRAKTTPKKNKKKKTKKKPKTKSEL